MNAFLSAIYITFILNDSMDFYCAFFSFALLQNCKNPIESNGIEQYGNKTLQKWLKVK